MMQASLGATSKGLKNPRYFLCKPKYLELLWIGVQIGSQPRKGNCPHCPRVIDVLFLQGPHFRYKSFTHVPLSLFNILLMTGVTSDDSIIFVMNNSAVIIKCLKIKHPSQCPVYSCCQIIVWIKATSKSQAGRLELGGRDGGWEGRWQWHLTTMPKIFSFHIQGGLASSCTRWVSHPHSTLGTPGELPQAPHKKEGEVWSLQPQRITGQPTRSEVKVIDHTCTCIIRKTNNFYKEKLSPDAYFTWEDSQRSCTDHLIGNDIKRGFKHKNLPQTFFRQSHPNLFFISLMEPPSTEFLNVYLAYLSKWLKVICYKGHRNNKVSKIKIT